MKIRFLSRISKPPGLISGHWKDNYFRIKKIICLLLVLQIASTHTWAHGRLANPNQPQWGIGLNTGLTVFNLKSPSNTGAGGLGGVTVGIDVSHGIGDWFRAGLELERSSKSFFNWGLQDYYNGDPAGSSPGYMGAAYMVAQKNFRGWNLYGGLSLGTMYAKYSGHPYPYPSFVRPGAVENALITTVKLGVERKVYRNLYLGLEYKFGRTWVWENGKEPRRHDLQGTYNTMIAKIGLKYYFL